MCKSPKCFSGNLTDLQTCKLETYRSHVIQWKNIVYRNSLESYVHGVHSEKNIVYRNSLESYVHGSGASISNVEHFLNWCSISCNGTFIISNLLHARLHVSPHSIFNIMQFSVLSQTILETKLSMYSKYVNAKQTMLKICHLDSFQ